MLAEALKFVPCLSEPEMVRSNPTVGNLLDSVGMQRHLCQPCMVPVQDMPAHVANLANPPEASIIVLQQRRSTIVWPRRRFVERGGCAAAFTCLAEPCSAAGVLDVTTSL